MMIIIFSSLRMCFDLLSHFLTYQFLVGWLALPATCLLNKRIIGGLQMAEERFPADISVHQKNGNTSVHICGGVLINPRWILTAAHCTIGRIARDLEVIIAKIERRIVMKIVRRNYDAFTGKNDVALLKIRQTFFVDTAPLPPSRYHPTGNCTVFGYGTTSSSSTRLPTTLQKAMMTIVPREQCETAIGAYQKLAEDLICAGGGTSDACQGDSGSPMLCSDGEDSLVLAGVVSAGFYGCATPGIPGVYTNVAMHRDWIEWALTSTIM